MVYLEMVQYDKVFNRLYRDPRDTLHLAETEAMLQNKTQILLSQNGTQTPATQNGKEEVRKLPSRIERWCFTYGSWKNKNLFSGNYWYSNLEGFDGLMGERNTKSTYPLYMQNLKPLYGR